MLSSHFKSWRVNTKLELETNNYVLYVYNTLVDIKLKIGLLVLIKKNYKQFKVVNNYDQQSVILSLLHRVPAYRNVYAVFAR